MRIQVLGDIAIDAAGARSITGPTQRRTLAMLVARRRESTSVDLLTEACWPSGDRPARAERNVRSYIHRLRQALGAASDRLETTSDGYCLHVGRDELDIDEFVDVAEETRRMIEIGDYTETLELAVEAARLWRGQPFAELSDEPWAEVEAAALRNTRTLVRERHAEALIGLGRPDEAVVLLDQLVADECYRERPRWLLMEALDASGRQPEALRAFQSFRKLLAEEVGVEPSPGLVELDQQIATGRHHRGRLAAPEIRGLELHERIGQGTNTLVHRATQRSLDRDVAIKIVRSGAADRPDFIRRFEAEARAVAAIEHPNVVPLYDFWREPGQGILVMRWMAGGSLERRLGDGPWPIERAATLVRDIAAALGAAHARGVCHHGVVPSNVLFDAVGRPHLGDFRIAMSDTGAQRSAPSEAVGDVRDLALLAVTLLTGTAHRHPTMSAVEELASMRALGTEVHAQLADVIETATAPTSGLVNAQEFAVEFERAATAHRSAPPRHRIDATRPNPYMGLHPFGEADAGRFHGRSTLVAELVDRFGRTDNTALVIVGASGAGKSSVVHAGLVPAIRRGAVPGSHGWFVTTMRPGPDPYEALHEALLRISVAPPSDLASRLRDGDDGIVREMRRSVPDADAGILLVVDQLEELFTVTTSPRDVDAFLRALAVVVDHPRSSVRLIATLRADFYAHPLRHPSFARVLQRHGVAITPLTPDEVEDAITGPARSVGLELGTGLVAQIVADVQQRPAALPLLQYALTEAVEAASGSEVGVADYRSIGGVTGALARRAEDLYGEADEKGRIALRHLFGRLVQVGDGNDGTRRRVLRSELPDDVAAEQMIATFGEARLLTFDHDPGSRAPTIEVSHEALIEEWPRLRGWLDDDYDVLRSNRQLSAAADSWLRAGRADSELYRGPRLEAARSLLDDPRVALNDLEIEFVRAGESARDAAAAVERRRRRRFRSLATVSAAVTVVALLASIAVALQWRRSARAGAVANSERLSEQALDAVDDDPDLAILLAIESVETARQIGFDPPDGVVEALHTVTQASRLLARFPTSGASDIHPGGDQIAVASPDLSDEVQILDVPTGRLLAGHQFGAPITAVHYVPDGSVLVVATERALHLVDADDLGVLAERAVECCIWNITVDGDDSLATVSQIGEKTITDVWQFDGLRHVGQLDDVIASGWLDSGLVVRHRTGVAIVDGFDGDRPLRRDIELELEGDVTAVAVEPATRTVLVADAAGVSHWTIDAVGRRRLDDLPVDTGVLFQSIDVARSGQVALAHGTTDEILVLPLRPNGPAAPLELRLPGHHALVRADTDGSGRHLLASGADEALLWDLSAAGPPDLGAIPTDGEVWGVEFTGDGTALVNDAPPGSQRVREIELATGRVVAEDARFADSEGYGPVMSPTGTVAGWMGGRDPSQVIDLGASDARVTLAPCEVPVAIDARDRWLVVSCLAVTAGNLAIEYSRVLDPLTGDTLLEVDDAVLSADIGPPGSPSDGILAYQRAEPGVGFHDLRRDMSLGTVHVESAWRPFFSPDGRYVTFGSFADGGTAVDVTAILDGVAPDDAIVGQYQPEPGATTFSVTVADWTITGHSGQLLRFWRLDHGTLEHSLPVDSGDSTFIAPTPDERWLYYESEGRLLRRFPLNLDDLVDVARARVQRDFTADECERFRISRTCDGH